LIPSEEENKLPTDVNVNVVIGTTEGTQCQYLTSCSLTVDSAYTAEEGDTRIYLSNVF
jgi:hypothetical protein